MLNMQTLILTVIHHASCVPPFNSQLLSRTVCLLAEKSRRRSTEMCATKLQHWFPTNHTFWFIQTQYIQRKFMLLHKFHDPYGYETAP